MVFSVGWAVFMLLACFATAEQKLENDNEPINMMDLDSIHRKIENLEADVEFLQAEDKKARESERSRSFRSGKVTTTHNQNSNGKLKLSNISSYIIHLLTNLILLQKILLTRDLPGKCQGFLRL